MVLIGKFIGVVLLAALGAGAGYGLADRAGLDLFDSALAAAAICAVVLSLAACGIALVGNRRLRRDLAAYSAYEEEVVRKLDAVLAERDKLTGLSALDERVANLEAALLSLHSERRPEPPEAAAARTGVFDAQTPPRQRDAGSKVVRLITGRKEIADGPSEERGRRETQRRIGRALSEEGIRIRLQPSVDLVSRKVRAVAASLWLNPGAGEAIAVDSVEALLDEAQKAQLDRFAVFELSRVVRMMEEDGQLVPVFYRFLLPGGGPDESWDAIAERLRGDRMLASHLIAITDIAALSRSGERHLLRLAELANHGVHLALGGIRRLQDIKQHSQKAGFHHGVVSADALLAYLPGSNRRYGEELLPALTRLGMEIVATGVNHRHQASGLLDLDVATAMGDLISKPRKIRLYPENTGSAGTGETGLEA
ncbi:MAG: EAL domain-containing protein [Nitratireductor sp.]|nr:EAL domain-containing protein [Nitratireductor sp.]